MKSLCGMLAVLAFTACSNDSDEATGNDSHIWHVSLTASMGDATNRALSADGENIAANFAQNDEVIVVDADGSTVVGTLKAQTAGGSTTLEGNISGTFAVDEVLKLHYLSATPNYDGQKGTLEEISSYAVGTLKVKTKSPLTFESNSVTLAPQQSITKFTFKSDGSDIYVKTFGIAATGLVQKGTATVGAVTGTLATANTEVYVALRNTSSSQQTYSFYIQDNTGNWYRGTKNATLANGKYYTATVSLTKLSEELTSSSTEGAVGVIGKLPAIVVNLGVTIGKKAVALMNTGALCPEHYGKYYTFANRESGLSDGWYVPSQEELNALADISGNTWVTENGVAGRRYTIGDNSLFFPAAGYDDADDDPHDYMYVSEFGYYWSSKDSGTNSVCYSFSSSTNNTNSSHKTDGLTVRPFHSLP